jgi:hypothetical protein
MSLYTQLQASYTHPDLAYQDISLLLQLYPQAKLQYHPQSQSNGHHIIIAAITPTHTLSFPQNYPQYPPSVSPSCHLQILDTWHEKYAKDITNEGIPPRDNRLVNLLLELSKQSQSQSQTQTQRPSLPPKPTVSRQIPPNETFTSSSIGSVTAPALPPNPVRTSLLSALPTHLSSSLQQYLSSLELPLLQRQASISSLFATTRRTDAIVKQLSQQSTTASQIVHEITTETQLITDQVSTYVHNNYDGDQIIIGDLLDPLCELASINDKLHLLDLLVTTRRIPLSDYIAAIRDTARDRAISLQSISI